MIDRLGVIERAYCVCYALELENVSYTRTLTIAEATAIVAIVQDVHDGHIVTELDHLLAHKLSPAMKIYIAEGLRDEETL